MENILNQPVSPTTTERYPAGAKKNRIMVMRELYRDYLVINRQLVLNSTESAWIKDESPIIDTDFPNYGKKVVPPTPDVPATNATALVQEAIADETT